MAIYYYRDALRYTFKVVEHRDGSAMWRGRKYASKQNVLRAIRRSWAEGPLELYRVDRIE